MLKTIKVEKQMHIGELLEYVRKNELRGRYFRVMNESRYIKITPGGVIYFDADFCFRPDDTFTVEVEEEINNTTIFKSVVGVLNNDEIMLTNMHTTIEGIQDRYGSMKEIYAVIDGKLQLVWERDEE